MQVAGSPLGRMHTKETKIKMSISKKTTYNTAAGTVAVSKPVVVTDTRTSTTTTYLSIKKAEAALNASQGSLNKCLK